MTTHPETLMPEPTTDRGVGELSDEELIAVCEGMATMAGMATDKLTKARIGRWGEARAELLRRLNAATERPAEDVVTISKEDVEQALDAMAYVKERLDYFWDKWNYQSTYDRMKAALSAERDGAPT